MGPIEEMRPEQLRDLERRIAARRRTLAEGGSSWRSSLIWSLCALGAFFALDGLVFHSGWYMAYLQPQSSAGQLESRIFWLRHEAEVPETAVLGDSRIGEGFSARTAEAATGGAMRFRNIAVAGSTPRVWYYLLRDADPERKRFPIVVLAMDLHLDHQLRVEALVFNPPAAHRVPAGIAHHARLTEVVVALMPQHVIAAVVCVPVNPQLRTG